MSGIDKVFYSIKGRPLLAYTVDAFEDCGSIPQIVLVLASDKLQQGAELKKKERWKKVSKIVPGGVCRQESVKNGLDSLSPCEWVVIHDGARPCVDTSLIERGLKAAKETGAAIAALPASDTIKIVSSAGLVESTPPRETLWLVQTPQVFKYDLLLRAHRDAQGIFTDDAAAVEAIGVKVKVYQGSRNNIKVTVPEDVSILEAILRQQRRL